MPFIRRRRVAEAESTFSKVDSEHEFHIAARKVEKGDVVIPHEQIPDAILADLAVTHPKEYAKAALDRGLKLVVDDEDDDEDLAEDADDEELEDVFTERQEAFMLLNAEKAIAAVQAAKDDPDTLAEYAEAEAAKEQPRKTVLAALEAALES